MTKIVSHAAVWGLVVLAAIAASVKQATTETRVGRQSTVPARPKIDVSKLGPQVGDRVPDFSLRDQNGRTWTRQSIMGPRGAMLVFVRSADW